MPITDALKTARDLERAGLSPVVAQVLAEKFEETAQATHDSLKDFIRQEFTSLRAELGIKFAQIDGKFAQIDGRFSQLEGKMEGRFGELEAKFERSLRMQLVAMIALASLAVAIIKLFPNWH